jgi:hypothetical protein
LTAAKIAGETANISRFRSVACVAMYAGVAQPQPQPPPGACSVTRLAGVVLHLLQPARPAGPATCRPRFNRGATRDLFTHRSAPPDRLYDGYVFDLDGTVYLGDALLPGAGEVIASVRARGCRTVFLSNNPTRDPQMYTDKLGKLGIPTPSRTS